MAKNIPRSGKQVRPKTAVKGKRFLCARCRKRSPRRVTTPAPWYSPNCLKETDAPAHGLKASNRDVVRGGTALHEVDQGELGEHPAVVVRVVGAPDPQVTLLPV